MPSANIGKIETPSCDELSWSWYRYSSLLLCTMFLIHHRCFLHSFMPSRYPSLLSVKLLNRMSSKYGFRSSILLWAFSLRDMHMHTNHHLAHHSLRREFTVLSISTLRNMRKFHILGGGFLGHICLIDSHC
jgi:hypothetical protein